MNTGAARDFWLARSRRHTGTAAMHPRSRWSAYDNWTRRMVQDWTLGRIRRAAPHYRRCLDLGCGIGDWTERFAELAIETYACDLAPRFVATTRARVPSAVVECADLRTYKLPPNADLIYVGAVLTYLPDQEVRDLLRRIRAAATPNAMVVIQDYGAINLGESSVNAEPGFYGVHRHVRGLRRFANDAFLRCVEQRVSPSIYGEVMARGSILQWPMRAAWRLATAHWRRASYTLIMRAD